MLLLDGKATAAAIHSNLRREIERLAPRAGRSPGLAVVLAGDDPASQVYVRNKEKACAQVGITSFASRLPGSISQQGLQEHIRQLNEREDVDGILLQLPLPGGLNSLPCIESISPAKDVDGLHPENQGRLAMDQPGIRPCTPAGVIALLRHYNLPLEGKRAVVAGRSNLVGRPLALLLSGRQNNATVTMCHSYTAALEEECRQADYLFLAMGRPHMVGPDMVKEGAVVVDIGISRREGKLCGDADFSALLGKVSAMTPVPGGVGPMTIAQLLSNTVQAWKQRAGLR